MERWSSIDEEGVHLATIRVYHHAKSSSGKKPKIMLMLPVGPDNPDQTEEFELDMVNEAVENQVVIAEREKDPGSGSRARTTILTGRVKHECNLRPVLSERYRQRLRERHRFANQPARTIKRIEDEHPGDRGAVNRLTSGVSNTSGFSDLIVRDDSAVLVMLTFSCSSRDRSRSHQKASSSVWPVCRATSSSICSSCYSASRSTGLSSLCASVRSSRRRILRRYSAISRSCTGVASTTVLGSYWRTLKAMV